MGGFLATPNNQGSEHSGLVEETREGTRRAQPPGHSPIGAFEPDKSRHVPLLLGIDKLVTSALSPNFPQDWFLG